MISTRTNSGSEFKYPCLAISAREAFMLLDQQSDEWLSLENKQDMLFLKVHLNLDNNLNLMTYNEAFASLGNLLTDIQDRPDLELYSRIFRLDLVNRRQVTPIGVGEGSGRPCV